jgi:small subunit ribosomal protein S8
MMTDPIADMLTRIRNAIHAGKRRVDIPRSKMKVAIADLLQREGYIKSFKVLDEGIQGTIRVYLKYTADQSSVIEGLERVSRPGLRIYADRNTIPQVLGGYGTAVLSTSRGILTGHEARQAGVGGEVICRVW